MLSKIRVLPIGVGALVASLWWYFYSDPLAAIVVIVGATLAWPVALIRNEEYGLSYIVVGGTAALMLVGGTLRLMMVIETGDSSGGIIGGFLSQGAILAFALGLVHSGVNGRPLSAMLEDDPAVDDPSAVTNF